MSSILIIIIIGLVRFNFVHYSHNTLLFLRIRLIIDAGRAGRVRIAEARHSPPRRARVKEIGAGHSSGRDGKTVN